MVTKRMGRAEYVINEAEYLLGTDWPENIAHRLGYTNIDNLICALRRWGRPDLAERFNKASYDGLAHHSSRPHQMSGAA